MTTMLNDILKLSESERILMAETIWDSIDSKEYQFDLTNDLKEVLDSRLADHSINPNEGSFWQEVNLRVSSKL